ncbi:MAG: GNAT family N-acetyltransferase [Dehalococcoidia bacterium]
MLADDVAARGRKVILRRKRLSDAADDYAWRSDEELARYDAVPPLRISFTDFVASLLAQLRYPDPARRSYAIEDESGHHIGNAMYYNLSEEMGEAELGITIGDCRYWNQGYGSDAVQALVKLMFREKRLRRMFLHTLDWNVRAQRCFEKAGFVPCGLVRRDGLNFLLMETLQQPQQTASA